MRLSASLRLYSLVFVLYLLAALLITWPLVTVLGSQFAGFGYSDAYEMAHHIWWFKHAVSTGQPLFFQPLMGYPDGIEGITLWAHPLQFFPAWALALVMPLPVASNLVILVTLALNGVAMFALARRLAGNDVGVSLLAGLVFMAFPTLQGHLGAAHAGLLVQWPLPLFTLALLRLHERVSIRAVLLAAFLFVVSAWGHTLQIVYATIPVAVFVIGWLAWHREWRAVGRAIAACGIGVIALGIFLFPVARATLGSTAYTDAGGAVRYSADLLSVATPSFFHPLFGQLDYTRQVLGVNIDEGAAYLGITVALLALVAAVKVPAARGWLLLGAAVYVLSLGPLLKLYDRPLALSLGGYDTFVPLPTAVFERLPLLNLARTPGRFNFTLGLVAAALAAYGAAALLRRTKMPTRGIVLAGLAALVLFEYQTFWPLPTTTADVPAAITALRDRDDVRAVLDLPWDNLVAAKEGLYLQTQHEQALIAGQVTRGTPVSPAKLTLLQNTLDPALLTDAGADVVIVHREHDTDGVLLARAQESLGDAAYIDDRFALFETPARELEEAAFITEFPADFETENGQDLYVYTVSDRWAIFEASLTAENRLVTASLDGGNMGHWQVDGTTIVHFPLFLSAGYHTVRLALDPVCPTSYSTALRCRSLTVSGAHLNQTVGEALPEPVVYGGGVVLQQASARLVEGENAVEVWLQWEFSAPRDSNDVRFIHLVGPDGAQITGQDNTLGVQRAGDGLAEIVRLDVPPDLPEGDYKVYAGWYRYPELTRFPVQSPVEGAENGLALVGVVRVGE